MNDSFVKIEAALSKKMLNHACLLLRPFVAKQTDSNLSDRLQSIETNYRYLTDYFLSGGDDPERTIIINQLTAEAYRLLDTLILEENLTSTLRQPLLAHLQEKHTGFCANAKDTFYRFLLLHDADVLTNDWNALLATDDMVVLQMALSALTLNVLSDFSEPLFLLLINCAGADQKELSDIALTGCVLLLHKYKERLPFFSSIEDHWLLLTTDPRKRETVQQICTKLLSTTLSSQVNQAMNNLQKDIALQHNKISPKSNRIVITLNDMEEGNPEWGETLNKVVSKHSETIMRLHKTGADINYGSTAMLLGQPFFQSEITHWFLPFSTENEDLHIDFQSETGKLLLKIIYTNIEACSIDRYATCLAIGDAAKQLSQEILPKELLDMSDEDISEMRKETSSLTNELTLYIHNLFRFFRHNPWGFHNEMAVISDICRTTALEACLADAWNELGDYCMDIQLYAEAEYIFKQPALPTSIHLWQKIGYSLQKQARYKEAIQLFEKVLTLQDDDTWTLQHIATCLIKQGEYNEASLIYDRLLALKPDTPKYILLKAQCLLADNQTEKALQLFFRLDILTPEEINHQRGLAWCAFILGKDDIAQRYFLQITQTADVVAEDYLNYAHSLLTSKQRAEALQYYQKSLSAYDSKRAFLSAFRKDTDVLTNKGITLEELRLIEDCLLFT